MTLVLWRRRFRCLSCLSKGRRPRTFSEPDSACGLGPKGRGRRTTRRLREHIAPVCACLRATRRQVRRTGRPYRLRYALLRDPAGWTEKERQGLQALFTELPELRKAWEHKEAFRKWYEALDRVTAEARLTAWEQQVREDGATEYRPLFVPGSMLRSWREELLNYFDHRYTNGYTEGKNNRTKQLQRHAFGYSNRENLRLRILLPAA